MLARNFNSSRTTLRKSTHLKLQLLTTSSSPTKVNNDRSRRLERRKGAGVRTMLDENKFVPHDTSSSLVEREAIVGEGHDDPGPRRQHVIDVSGVSIAYQESATAKYRQQLQRDQNIAKLRESGSVVASTSAAAQHRRTRADHIEEARKSLKTNPSSLKIPVSAEALEMVRVAQLNQIDAHDTPTGEDEFRKEEVPSWGPRFAVGGLVGGSILLFFGSTGLF